MSKPESILEYYHHQLQNCEVFLDECRTLAQPEMVHQLRLSIKKIRAFNKLARQIGIIDSSSNKDLSPGLKKMFILAGRVRDTQVQIKILETYQQQSSIDYNEFHKWLLHREKKKISRLNKATDRKLPGSSISKHISETDNSTSLPQDEYILSKATEAVNDLYAKAQKLSVGYISNDALHRIRRITKQMRYILTIIINSYPEFSYSQISIASLREIETAIGNWHDNLVRMEMLDIFFSKIPYNDNSITSKYKTFSVHCLEELKSTYESTSLIVKDKLLE
jgi:CHAD domain-containing protein